MRTVLGVLSLLMVVAVIGVLAKKQLRAQSSVRVPAVAGASAPAGGAGATLPQQSQQIQQQVKQSIESTMQQARPEPEEK
jgi:uncharacterized membrane protein